jgi:predicted alpha/beta hydrolase family esterase
MKRTFPATLATTLHAKLPAALIVPGLDGSPEGHWQRWWLEDQDNSTLVEQADWSRPDLESWIMRLEFELMASGPAVLVAHSLGAVLVAALAGRASAANVIGALLVAPCDLDRANLLHKRRIDFPSMPRLALPFPSILVASRTDPYMDIPIARRFAEIWGSALVDLGDAGHINVASGFGRWPDAYALASAFCVPRRQRDAVSIPGGRSERDAGWENRLARPA